MPERAAPEPDPGPVTHPEPGAPPFVGVLSGFVAALRAAGLAAGTGDLLVYCAAMVPLDPTDLLDLYWAGRATLVSRKDDIEVYDQVFRAYFLADSAPAPAMMTISVIPCHGCSQDASSAAAIAPSSGRPGPGSLSARSRASSVTATSASPSAAGT